MILVIWWGLASVGNMRRYSRCSYSMSQKLRLRRSVVGRIAMRRMSAVIHHER